MGEIELHNRQSRLIDELDHTIRQCNKAVKVLQTHFQADITINLLLIERAVIECRCIMTAYEEE